MSESGDSLEEVAEGGSTSRNTYLIAAAVVWAAIWVATGAVLADDAFNDMIPILGGGTVRRPCN